MVRSFSYHDGGIDQIVGSWCGSWISMQTKQQAQRLVSWELPQEASKYFDKNEKESNKADKLVHF